MSEGWRYYLDFKGETFELSDGEQTVGRSRTCEVSVDDPSVSRRHVQIKAEHGHVLLKDLGSSNGSFINGERVEDHGELQDGDTLGLGDADVKVRIVGTSAFETVRMSAHPMEEQHGEATLFLQRASEKLAAEAMDHEQDWAAVGPSHMAPPPPEPASHMAPPPVQPLAAPPEPAPPVEPEPPPAPPEPPAVVAPLEPLEPLEPIVAPPEPVVAPPEPVVAPPEPVVAPPEPPPVAPAAAAPEPPPVAAAPEPPPAAAPIEPPPAPPEPPAPVPVTPPAAAPPPPPAAPPAAPPEPAVGAQSVLDQTTGDQASGDLLPSLDGFDITMGPEMMRAVKPQNEEKSTATAAATYNPYGAPQVQQQEAAGFGRRFAAFFVDGLWMAAVNLAVYFAGKSLGPAVTSSMASAVAILVVLFGWAIWGTTPGKRVFNLYVTSGTGSGAGIGFPRALARVVGYVLSTIPLGIGFLMIAFSSSKRGLHDLIAGTQVQRQV